MDILPQLLFSRMPILKTTSCALPGFSGDLQQWLKLWCGKIIQKYCYNSKCHFNRTIGSWDTAFWTIILALALGPLIQSPKKYDGQSTNYLPLYYIHRKGEVFSWYTHCSWSNPISFWIVYSWGLTFFCHIQFRSLCGSSESKNTYILWFSL